MYLSGSFLGYSSFISPSLSPSAIEYTKVEIIGKGTFDKLNVLDYEMTLSDLLTIDIVNPLDWNINTVIAAEFTNNLNAGNLNLGGSVEKWEVYRQKDGETSLVKVASLGGAEELFMDYTVPPYSNYTYIIFGSTSTEISEPLTAPILYADFFNYFLIDEDTNTVYVFNLNAQMGGVDVVEDVTFYDTYNQFPTVSQGSRKYRKTTLSAICGDVNCDGTITQPPEYISTLKDFVLNGRTKLFKTRKGVVARVYTNNFSYSVLEEAIQSQPMVVSFDITEISEV